MMAARSSVNCASAACSAWMSVKNAATEPRRSLSACAFVAAKVDTTCRSAQIQASGSIASVLGSALMLMLMLMLVFCSCRP